MSTITLKKAFQKCLTSIQLPKKSTSMRKFSLFLSILALGGAAFFLNFEFKPTAEMGGKKLFNKFISNFDKAELPYQVTFQPIKPREEGELEEAEVIDENHPHYAPTDKIITQEFSAFVPGIKRALYSRSGPDRHYFKDVLFENDEMIVVTYGTMSHYMYNSLSSYMLATYSKNPRTKATERLLSLRPIARNYYGTTMNCTIDENLRITTTTMSMDENEELVIEKETFQIAEDGKIKVVIKSQQQKKPKIIRAN